MASREEEKRRRREERLAAEREATRRQERSRRLRLGGGLALLAVIVTAVVIAVAGGGGGDDPSQTSAGGEDLPTLPAVRETDLEDAAKAARCRLQDFPGNYDDRGHYPDESAKAKFETNPPSFGRHFNTPASDGNYVGQGTPAPGNYVHSLEHGRIQYQYRPGLPARQVRQLEALFEEKPEYVQVFENNTRMKGDVAAVAWTHILRCDSFNPRVFDAMRAFRDRYTLKAPEVIPQPQ